MAIGDLRDSGGAQDGNALAGKVLRVDCGGQAVPMLEHKSDHDPRIFGLGFRQPTGLAFHPGSEELFISEDGAGQDEITRIKAGANGGWDPRCPATDAAPTYCGESTANKQRPLAAMTDLAKYPHAVRPLWTNLGRAQGMAGTEFLRGAIWKAWNGALAVGFGSGKRLDVLQLDAQGNVSAHSSPLSSLPVGIRALVQGPDGSLYVATEGKPDRDEIWRVTPR